MCLEEQHAPSFAPVDGQLVAVAKQEPRHHAAQLLQLVVRHGVISPVFLEPVLLLLGFLFFRLVPIVLTVEVLGAIAPPSAPLSARPALASPLGHFWPPLPRLVSSGSLVPRLFSRELTQRLPDGALFSMLCIRLAWCSALASSCC